MEYLAGATFNIFKCSLSFAQATPHCLFSNSFPCNLSTVHRKYFIHTLMLACSGSRTRRQRRIANAIFICLSNISIHFNHLNRSFACSLFFHSQSLNRFSHFGARPNENDILNLKRAQCSHLRCVPRIHIR